MDNSLTDPAEVLALAGLTLPDGASGSVTGVDNEATTSDRSLYAYIVTLNAPRESFEWWTDTAGVNIYRNLGSWTELLDDDIYGVEAAIGVADAPPEDSLWDPFVWFDPGVKGYSGHYEVYLLGPEQTTAHVLVYTAHDLTSQDLWDALS